MRTPKLRLNLLASSLLLGLSSMVQAANEVNFDLPAAPLEQSLNALAGQSAAQILFSSDIASDKQAGELRGRYSTGEALQRLLEGSGLEVHQQGENTFIIVSREAALSQAPSAAPLQLGAMDVTATRTSSSLVPQVRQVDVIEREKLEQLRYLEFGRRIKMVETSHVSIGIDTAEDLERAREIFRRL